MRSVGADSGRPLLSVVSFLSITLCAACADRLSGPEAVRLVDAVASSRSPTAEERDQRAQVFWDMKLGMISSDHTSSLLRTASRVVIRRDGHPRTYHGVVFESVKVPPSPQACLGTYWEALLWSEDERSWVGLRGGDFGRRLDPEIHWRSDCNHLVSGPEPWLDTTDDDTVWVANSGEGNISRGVVLGECPFLTPEAAAFLLEARGVTCDLTRHQVRFHARIQRASAMGKLLVSERTFTSEIELPPSEIIGIRITIHCDGTERTDRLCPRKRRASEPLAP